MLHLLATTAHPGTQNNLLHSVGLMMTQPDWLKDKITNKFLYVLRCVRFMFVVFVNAGVQSKINKRVLKIWTQQTAQQNNYKVSTSARKNASPAAIAGAIRSGMGAIYTMRPGT